MADRRSCAGLLEILRGATLAQDDRGRSAPPRGPLGMRPQALSLLTPGSWLLPSWLRQVVAAVDGLLPEARDGRPDYAREDGLRLHVAVDAGQELNHPRLRGRVDLCQLRQQDAVVALACVISAAACDAVEQRRNPLDARPVKLARVAAIALDQRLGL